METEKPIRVKLSRKGGWRKPPNTVVVARPTKWGNPYHVAEDSDLGFVKDIATAVEFHRQWIRTTEAGQQIAQLAKEQLRGKNLACWCPLPGPCHADTLLELANE
jgi:hypothetical protein